MTHLPRSPNQYPQATYKTLTSPLSPSIPQTTLDWKKLALALPTLATMIFTVEVECSASASRMFKASLMDWHNLGPKIAPHLQASASVVKGDSTPGFTRHTVGSMRQLDFDSSVMPFSYIQEHLDSVDHEKFECKASAVAGGHLETILESASDTYKIEPTSSGGCICKVVTEWKLKPGAEAGDEEARAKEFFVNLFKSTEAYLLENPDAYI